MGVAGSGKTTIARLLAQKLQWPYHDADDYHPKSNLDKMRKGFALDDHDRLPWLRILRECMEEWNDSGNAVLACSALKESYRQVLNKEIEVQWVLLHGSKEVIEERIIKRADHFMQASLLESQLETLEIPDYALHVNVDQQPEQIVDTIIENLIYEK